MHMVFICIYSSVNVPQMFAKHHAYAHTHTHKHISKDCQHKMRAFHCHCSADGRTDVWRGRKILSLIYSANSICFQNNSQLFHTLLISSGRIRVHALGMSTTVCVCAFVCIRLGHMAWG